MEHINLDAVIDRLLKLEKPDLEKIATKAQEFTAAQGLARWQPNPGSQTVAYYCDADEIGYGGEAGPGKTALIIGLAMTKFKRSLILRRTNNEARGLVDEFEKFLGYKPKLDKSDSFRVDGRKVQIGGCQWEDDKQKFKGHPQGMMAFDQLEDFTESQYTFITQWNRSADPSESPPQIYSSINPPTSVSGMWILKRWGPWLDPHHPRKAPFGEKRWFTTVNGEDTEVDGPGPHLIDGKATMARSRTFIRGRLEENVDLMRSNYDSVRAAAPEEYRAAYRDGDFEAAMVDAPNQVCPTAWVRAAVKRWTPRPPEGIPMCTLGVDASGGGKDPMIIAIRYDGWYAPMEEIKGRDIPVDRAGKFCAGQVVGFRRDDAVVIIDMGGGYGMSTYEQLKENHIPVESFKGSEKSTRRTKEGLKGFANRRSEVYWKFREALEPSQESGSPIFLPDDPLLIADLCAPVFKEDSHLIELEPKDQVREALGRSPDRGDAVVMAWAAGMRYVQGGMALQRAQKYNYAQGRRPQVLLGRAKYNRRGS